MMMMVVVGHVCEMLEDCIDMTFWLFLDKLDGLSHGIHKHTSMEDYLQLSNEYYVKKNTPGQKMVCILLTYQKCAMQFSPFW